MNASASAVEAVGLTRRYGEATVLDAVDLQGRATLPQAPPTLT
jgi:hypothetical protein